MSGWWSKPRKVTLGKPNDKTQLLSLADAYREELTAKVAAPMTVPLYIERWQERRKTLVAGGSLKQSSIDRENTTLQHIKDYMGDMVLADMTAADISDAYTKMANDGMSMSTR